ncbi:exopolyphosphatase [Hahella sp. CCB-MM4]|uniref:exopolyphosphatase n=1 Tax=Hahella sp. (strain CCB-MM4) TaxID=1926491 RepID=UPI000B9B2196|nr:exopolyphosphatase [Hahella sp. CCB-MM4]OZG74644.1 exopolyphosphatase [Hahella sp. CCB-MM4]
MTNPTAAAENQPTSTAQSDLIAAIDMGSNSFHMVVAQLVHNEIRPLEKLGEKVQLAAGLDGRHFLDDASQHRALACLERFAQRLQGMSDKSVLVVGTNALRVAKNTKSFLRKAEKVLGHKVSIISGREEARLIYLGVAHSLADDADNRLVIDIGGGSTEFIIGQRFETRELESLHMGCVSYRDKYFSDGKISSVQMARAVVEASRELLSIRNRYRKVGWHHCVGSSGSIKTIAQVLIANQWSKGDAITMEGLTKLHSEVVRLGSISRLTKLGVRKDRLSIFPSGLAILLAAFDVLKIEEMEFCDGALREGLLYDMIGRNQHEDVRERTINSLQERYFVDRDHARAVANTADLLWQALHSSLELSEDHRDLLRWASELHEIGLAISHSQFHKHGAYLVRYSDLAGFSRQSQFAMAVMVRFHRRKINDVVFSEYCTEDAETLKPLSVLIRLAVVLQRTRSGEVPEGLTAQGSRKNLHLQFPKNWLKDRSLILAELEAEQGYLNKFGLKLTFDDN